MYVLLILLVVLVGALIGWRYLKSGGRMEVLDRGGRRRFPLPSAGKGYLAALAGVILLGVLMLIAIRVVPVGHGLVVFNTITGNFHMAPQGVTLVVPLVTQTQLYDLRRHEYTMTSTRGEGRKAEWDDSLWSPTQEGLQVGIDMTAWHHLDPLKVTMIHQRIGPEYEEKII